VAPVVTTGEPTRARIITAAEALFAQRGIDGVSLREITRVAGTKNTVALQYHFDDRDGVVRAILAKHLPEVAARRHALLDQVESSGSPPLRALAVALVQPLAAKLEDNDGGPAFLQIYAELVNRPRAAVTPEIPDAGTPFSLGRWRTLIGPLLDPDAVRLHRRFTAIRLTAFELGRRAGSGPHADERLFVSHLVDLVTGTLAAPVSEDTIRLADARDASRARRRRSVSPSPVRGRRGGTAQDPRS
jgi:AcrR family transcriptional regulator